VRRAATLTCLGVFIFAAQFSAAAHPLGNFTINHFVSLQPGERRVLLHYVIDMAEIPAFQATQGMEKNADGSISLTSLNSYLESVTSRYASGLLITVDGTPIGLRTTAKTISMPVGSGGLPTLRMEFDFEGEIQATSTVRLFHFKDTNNAERIGWHEIVLRPAPNTHIFNSTSFGSAITDELKSYPQDMLSTPLNEREAEFSVTSAAMPLGAIPLQLRDGQSAQVSRDRFVDLISVPQLTPGLILLGLGFAILLGAFHALSPGHGKTIVGAYLVGSRGTARHAAFLGLTVTITHTAGVFALGMATLFASQYILPERLFSWLSILSGAIVVAIGATLTLRRLAGLLAPASRAHEHDHHGDEDSNLHDHDHGRNTALPQKFGPGAAAPPSDVRKRSALSSVLQNTFGLRPKSGRSPASFKRTSRKARGLPHIRRQSRCLRTTFEAKPPNSTEPHTHGGHTHSHLPPGADGSRVTWKSLLALGISGGILPCPSALVVLLAAISLHRVAYGLLLVLAFSVGLAGVLTAVGMLFVYAGRILKTRRSSSRSWGRLSQVLPLASALVITCAGLVICYETLSQAGSDPVLAVSAIVRSLIHRFAGAETSFTSIGTFGLLILGLVYGLKHATEADHVVAVSTIVSEHQKLRRAAFVGALWGAGHTASLVVVGTIVLMFKVSIPQQIAGWLEFFVALMIIGLGVIACRRALQGRADVHLHRHSHGVRSHVHLHFHEVENTRGLDGSQHSHEVVRIGAKPLIVGAVHGLAGSATLTLLVLTQIGSPFVGLLYLAIFGVGSIIGMLIMSGLVGLPFVFSSRLMGSVSYRMQLAAGALSVLFGIWYAFQTV
jgi:ABC-type nickel/cobalt efflux system permease component RcnA